MTYAQFHAAFTLPWLAVLAWDAAAGRTDPRRARRGLVAVGVLIAVALAYTYPWDRYLILEEVWGYPDGRVLATLGGVPMEEVAFFAIQTAASGLAALALRRRLRVDGSSGARGAPLLRALPALAALWDAKKNDQSPSDTLAMGYRTAWWRCDKGHSFQRKPRMMVSDPSCPTCALRG